MSNLKVINIKDIIIGERFRKDMGNLQELADSIKEKGVCQPITVRDTGVAPVKYELLAGGRRVAATGLIGLLEIPALVRPYDESPEAEIDAREIELLENVQRKDFTWVEKANLVEELNRLCKDRNINWSGRKTAQLMDTNAMDVSRNLRLAEGLKIVPELASCKTQDEALKQLRKLEDKLVTHQLRERQKEIRNSGLVDTLDLADANYKIGDVFEGMAAIHTCMGGDFIECDPPYGIELNEVKRGDSADAYREVAFRDYPEFLGKLCQELYRIAGSNSWMVFWFGPTHFSIVKESLLRAGWEVDDIPGIWNKGNGQTMQPSIYLGRSYEPFFSCRKGRPALVRQGRSNVFTYTPVAGTKKYHPTERPIELIEDLIETYVGPGSKLFIPFLGSGATIRAAYNCGCSAFGYDIDPAYKDKFMLAVEADTKKLDSNDTEDIE